MKRSTKTLLIIVAVASVAGLAWWVSRPNEPAASSASETSRGTSFEVNIERPRIDRPFGGILPSGLEAKLFGGELRFNHASRDARMGSVGLDRIELSADGWDLLVETDGEGRVGPGTRLVFPIEIANTHYSLRCRPAAPAVGYLHVTARAGSDVLDGRFVVEFVNCENAVTGKILDTEAGGNPGQAWPSSPLILRGSFVGPATRPSTKGK